MNESSGQHAAVRIGLIAAFAGLLAVDLVYGWVPAVAGYAVVVAFAVRFFPLSAPISMCVIAVTALPVWVAVLSKGQLWWFPSVADLVNRAIILGVTVFLARRWLLIQQEESRLSRFDELTGLANRRMMSDRLEAELNRSRRHKHAISLLFLDCDRFKQLNDERGHAEGDRALQIVAETLQNSLRNYDLPARWGGDEFLVLLPETNAEQVQPVVTRLQNDLRAAMKALEWNLSFSLGVVTTESADVSPDDLIERADRVMYEAKQAGGGRTGFAVWESTDAAVSA